MNGKNDGFGNFATGFVLGGLVGGTIAVLTVPRSGEETRAQIRAKSTELRDSTEQAMQETMHTLNSAASDVSSRAEELRVQSQAVMEQSRKQWMDAAEEIAKIAEDAMHKIRRTASESLDETERAAVEASKEA